MKRAAHRRIRALLAASVATLALAPAPADARDCSGNSVGLPPLPDLGTGTHLGFQGGLYPDGANLPPAGHAAEGAAHAAAIEPLDALGRPDPDGKIVVLMIGMSNGVLEFRRLVEKLEADPEIDADRIVLAMGARGGQSAETWEDPGHENFERIEDRVLGDLGVTEAQVQVVLVKSALQSQGSPPTLPAADAQVYDLERALGNGARALRSRYPQLRQVFYTSRIYAGYATIDLSPEPYAWENGLGIKWLIEAQIAQRADGTGDPESGDLGTAVAPWLAWGPYLWADGDTPRSDGFFWACSDLREDDGTHPGEGAIEKVAVAWYDFLRTSVYTRPWLLGEAVPALCGDGNVDPGEACDDGNTTAGDGCDGTCQLEAVCGDGAIAGAETCDDGNTRSGDGCDEACRLESPCGNGTTEGAEECDDGGTAPGDGCSPICRVEPCPLAPRGDCADAPSGSLQVSEHRTGREKLALKLGGFAAPASLLGDPVDGTTRYGACVYDGADTLVTTLEVDATAQTCGANAKPCWKRAGRGGFRYRDPDAAASGVARIRLRSGDAPKGRARVNAANHAKRGRDALPTGIADALAGHTTARIQLAAHDGGCVSASLGRVVRDDGKRWKARTD